MLRETITMWKYTKMNVLVAITAAVYAGLMIPFKPIQIIPGFAELRPAVVIPITFGILFGPAAAWGSAIGNIIGDFFGTPGMGSIPGAIGNFFFPLVCYKLFPIDILKKAKGTLGFNLPIIMRIEIAVILASGAVAFTIAWGLEVLRLYPFGFFAAFVFLNNVILSFILVPILLFILFPRVQKWELLWTDILENEFTSNPKWAILGKILITVGVISGLVIGILVSTGYYHVEMFKFQKGGGSTGVIFSVLPSLVIFILGCLLA